LLSFWPMGTTSVKETLRRRMHETIDEQGAWLRGVVMGFNAYHAAPTNSAALGDFRFNIANLWRRTLCWRGQKGKVTWKRMTVLQNRWLPKPRITHPWPNQRFAVKHPRWEPGAGIPPAGICAGARGDARPYRDITRIKGHGLHGKEDSGATRKQRSLVQRCAKRHHLTYFPCNPCP
jgi:hypothetical protein